MATRSTEANDRTTRAAADGRSLRPAAAISAESVVQRVAFGGGRGRAMPIQGRTVGSATTARSGRHNVAGPRSPLRVITRLRAGHAVGLRLPALEEAILARGRTGGSGRVAGSSRITAMTYSRGLRSLSEVRAAFIGLAENGERGRLSLQMASSGRRAA